MTETCPFCDLTQIAGPIIEYGNVLVFTPLNPIAPGHRLVVPREHVADFAADPRVSAEVMAVASNLAHEASGAFNVITSRGAEATQSVMHLHLHLIPRSEGDGLKLPWTPLMDWQPIETAPAAMHVLASRFSEDAGEWVTAVVLSPPIYPFTHWMPLPPPPKDSQG